MDHLHVNLSLNAHSHLSATTAVFAIQCVTFTSISFCIRANQTFFLMISYTSVQLFKYFQLKWLPFLDSMLSCIN